MQFVHTTQRKEPVNHILLDATRFASGRLFVHTYCNNPPGEAEIGMKGDRICPMCAANYGIKAVRTVKASVNLTYIR